MKASDKANELISDFSMAVERVALSPSDSIFGLYSSNREDLEDYIAELEAERDNLAARIAELRKAGDAMYRYLCAFLGYTKSDINYKSYEPRRAVDAWFIFTVGRED